MLDERQYLQSAQAMQDLHALNARFIHNFITNDVAGHDAILHPDFVTIQSNGSYLDRAAYLRQWATGFDPEVIPYWDVRDERITIIGNLALVRSANKMVLRQNGQERTAMSVYTDSYLWLDGAWKCVQAQITPIEPENEPDDSTIISVYLKGVLQR